MWQCDCQKFRESNVFYLVFIYLFIYEITALPISCSNYFSMIYLTYWIRCTYLLTYYNVHSVTYSKNFQEIVLVINSKCKLILRRVWYKVMQEKNFVILLSFVEHSVEKTWKTTMFTGKSTFFRQINVSNKELISRKFLSMIALYSAFP